MVVFEKTPLNLSKRVAVCLFFTVFCFFVIAIRLWHLQVVQGDYFREQSENNKRRTVRIAPPRGLITDRNGKVIVGNRPAFNIELVKEDSPNPVETVTRLAEIVGEDPSVLVPRIKGNVKRSPFQPKLILKDVSRDLVARVTARRHELPGITVRVSPTRDYPYGEMASHVLGYIREISATQVERSKAAGFRRLAGDLIGFQGIEAKWERYLWGERGSRVVVVNARGTKVAEDSYSPERPGHTIHLTLDFDTQRAADEALKGKRGAIVALDPQTGEVLALSSSPGFNPNVFTSELPKEVWKDLQSKTEKKLVNRSIEEVYPPGSVFKIIMAAAALTEKKTNLSKKINCPGHFPFKGRRYHCHKRTGHGLMNLHKSLVKSCDVYFYKMGLELGVDTIHKYATMFGLGQKTGIELPHEAGGLVPSKEWKKRRFKEKWYQGETLSVSIGQGANASTVLQMARAIAALINGGKVLKPYLVREIVAADGSWRDNKFKPTVLSELEISEETREAIMKALVGVVQEQGGTGRRARIEGLVVGGKTGTSQVVSESRFDEDNLFHQDHGWFVGYAPAENPQIVVAAINEHGGHGGSAAAPLVNKVMAAFFKKPAYDDVKVASNSQELGGNT